MPLLQLPSINSSQTCVMGDVSIDDSVAIASGVILQADINCRLIIHAGVCIGMGAILHAHHGNIEVHSGVVLGAGVLIIGKAKIGNNTCIGSTTTIWNADVAPDRIIPSGSVIGNSGREIAEIIQQEISSHPESIQQLPQSTFVPPTTPASSAFIPPSILPSPLVSSTFVQPSPPPPITSTFVNPASVAPPLFSSPFIQPTPPSPVQSTFVAPNSHPISPDSMTVNSAEISQEIQEQIIDEESEKEEPQNDNHQFYGQNRINQLLGTLMPQNKPSS